MAVICKKNLLVPQLAPLSIEREGAATLSYKVGYNKKGVGEISPHQPQSNFGIPIMWFKAM
jgi:hypothetical protein